MRMARNPDSVLPRGLRRTGPDWCPKFKFYDRRIAGKAKGFVSFRVFRGRSG